VATLPQESPTDSTEHQPKLKVQKSQRYGRAKKYH